MARALAAKTDWPMLTREDLQEKAKQQGIRVGRLEVSIIKRPTLSEKLAREKKLYLAFLTATLCERALQGNLIYDGRAGHLLLPGVSHRLRVGLTAPIDIRIQRTARSLNMLPEQAAAYLSQLDDDIAQWIHYIHHAEGQDPNQFDVFFNLETTTVTSAAELLSRMVELREFEPTPTSTRLLKDLYLGAQAELLLILDEKTRAVDLKVQAENQVLTVTYPPHNNGISDAILQVLGDLKECREIHCTMAETNILWVQERFKAGSENFQQVIHLAQRWGAAVELMRLIAPEDVAGNQKHVDDELPYDFGRQECALEKDGGVEDDDPEDTDEDDGLSGAMEDLIDKGRCGGGQTVCGGYDKILERVRGDADYALVVVGDMFLSKGRSTRTRRTRELAMSIRDRLKAPVITMDELKSRFLFGKRQGVMLAGYAAIVCLIYILAFKNQDPILAFLSGPMHEQMKWLAPLVIVLFVPTIAYLYGTITGLILKLINID
ncbi:MAG: cytidylate kinase-like family protein [Deltaproteobacteria bacterium]|nr:cytidylate kinase-like family protein [Deltaproteobacteria bacterium]